MERSDPPWAGATLGRPGESLRTFERSGFLFRYFGGGMLMGGWITFLGGFLYAIAQIVLASLAGATAADSFPGWALAIRGIGYVAMGVGLFVALTSVGPSLSASGGKVALVGAFVASAPDFLFAVAPDALVLYGAYWNTYVSAAGFLLITLGLLIGFAGIAADRSDSAVPFARQRLRSVIGQYDEGSQGGSKGT